MEGGVEKEGRGHHSFQGVLEKANMGNGTSPPSFMDIGRVPDATGSTGAARRGRG